MGEENVVEFSAAVHGEDELRSYLRHEREQLKDITAADIVSSLETLLPDVDKAVLTGEFGDYLAVSIRTGLEHGPWGWFDDDRAFLSDWGFDLEAVGRPVAVWQGRQDAMVPYAHGEWLVQNVPGAEPHLFEDEGHLSLVDQLDVVLADLKRLGGVGTGASAVS